MINLLYTELLKIFHKKSIYIIWILIFIFCLFNNILYKLDYDQEGYYIKENKITNKHEIEELTKKLKKYDKNKKEDVEIYVDTKTEIDILKLKNKYNKKSFQYAKVDYLKNNLYDINYYTYIEKNNIELEKSKQEYYRNLDKFNKNQWVYFVEKEKKEKEQELKKIKEEINNNQNKKEQEELKETIKKLKTEIDIINIRINNNINYGINYLNDALTLYQESKEKINECNIKYDNYESKMKCNEFKRNLYLSKYIINKKVNLKQENNLNSLLRTIIEDYEIFIIIIVLLVSSSIISEEFNKGYIKLLLIKPFKRSKILLSKYLTTIIILIMTILITILFELIIGGYLFGFNTLSMKVAAYNFNTNSIQEFNIFIYMFIRIGYQLPKLLMLLTICFAIGVISCNTILSFSITMLLYTFSTTINNLLIKSNIHFLNYIITLNWDFKYYILSPYGPNEFITNKTSLIVYIVHLLIIIALMIEIFNKKNIKNI